MIAGRPLQLGVIIAKLSEPRSSSWCRHMFDATQQPTWPPAASDAHPLARGRMPAGGHRAWMQERGYGGTCPKPPNPQLCLPPVPTFQASEVPLFSTLPLPTRRAWRTMAAFDLGHNGSRCGRGWWVPVDVRLYALAGSEQQVASSSSQWLIVTY